MKTIEKEVQINKTQKHIAGIKERLEDKNYDIGYRHIWINQIKMLEKDLKYYQTGRMHY